MEDFLKKALHFGLGVYDFTKEKVEDLVADMVRRGEVSQQEGPAAVEKLMDRVKQEQDALTDKIKGLVTRVIGEMGLARVSDLNDLKARVAALEAKVQELTARGEPLGTE